ncbi:hypothetical protein NPX13_g9042 [Xylaria arbuscula]|uniref:Glutathione S-transferase UstS-like C-terminal domain-containing protein n=1 Tax=Xylaria arbuscula TaxID=114810 RepID=A0A9W8N7H4_9PEZI|nr:hypothetical protein NPX13_g9042 [Xylaria arbuscula]
MAASKKIVFFDIPTKEPIHALEYPEIKPRLQPHLPGLDEYTVPTVIMPDGTYIMDSKVIVRELEKQYPSSPPLDHDSPQIPKYMDQLSWVFRNLRPVFLVGVPQRLLKEVNHAYWNETRAEHVGMPLDQYIKEHSTEEAYKGATPHLQSITAMLKENDKGPFFNGDTIKYVDFAHAGFLLMFRQLGEDIFQPILEATGDPEVHLKFLEALKPWTERDNH